MIGHRITWGMPTETGGWQVVANSLPSLTKAQQSELVARTNVGTIDERALTDGFGYFGEFQTGDASWAVFAHLYKSEKPVYTGQLFVQRDICLAPLTDFKQLDYDAQPFFEVVPQAQTFPRVESTTAQWTADPRPQPLGDRLERLRGLTDEFLRELLLALLQPHSTIIVWQTPDAALLTALLLLFPAVARKRLTFCTTVGDLGAAQVHVKCVPAFKPDPSSAIVDLDRKLFRQPLTALDSALPAQLLAAWRGGKLAELHRYLDDVVLWTGDQTTFVKALDDALVQWLSRNELLREIDGGQRWDIARNHIRVMKDAPPALRTADRLFITEHLVRTFDPESEGTRLSSFLRELAPDGPETKRIEEAAGQRLAGTRTEAMKPLVTALAAAVPGDATRENLAQETFRRLPPNRRRLEELPALETVFARKGGALPSEVLDDVLRDWTFDRMPKWAEIRSLLARVTTRDRLSLLENNKGLVASLSSVPHGQIALELVRSQFGSGNERALLDLAERYPAETADVVVTQRLASSELAVQIIARIAAKSRERKQPTAQNEALKELFVVHFEQSANDRLLADERVKLAMQWAGRTEEQKRRIEVVRSRFEGLSAEESLRELLLAPVRAWTVATIGTQPLKQLLGILSGAPSRWAWYVAAELHGDADFRLAEFCVQLRNAGRDANSLLKMIATLVLHSAERPRADAVDVLSCCVEAIADEIPNDPELRRRVATSWTPSGQREYARVLALLSAYTTRGDHELQRRHGLPLMRLEDQLAAIASRLEAFSVTIRDVAHWPELERLTVLADERDAIDFGRVENAIQRLLESLDESALERVLKEHSARLRRRKKDGGWFPRPK
jgi:hypothetical protein